MPPGNEVAHRRRQPARRAASPCGRPPGPGARRRLRPVHERPVTTKGHLTQMEAARLAGCSRDTIVRARRSGRFPGARLEGGRWVIPGGDLIASGLYQPPAHNGGPSPTPPPATLSGSVGPAAVELARAETRIAGLEEVVARQDDELRFLRVTVDTLAKRGAA